MSFDYEYFAAAHPTAELGRGFGFGHPDYVKREYRLHRDEWLSLRLKWKRNKAEKLRRPKKLANAINEIWIMNFVADSLLDGRKLCMHTVADLYIRECLAIDVGQSLKGEDCVRAVTCIAAHRTCRRPSRPTTAANSSPGRWTSEPTCAASSWISAEPAGRLTTTPSKASTGGRARSA